VTAVASSISKSFSRISERVLSRRNFHFISIVFTMNAHLLEASPNLALFVSIYTKYVCTSFCFSVYNIHIRRYDGKDFMIER